MKQAMEKIGRNPWTVWYVVVTTTALLTIHLTDIL